MKQLFRLLKIAGKYRKYFIIGMAGLVVNTAAQLYSPQVSKKLIELISDEATGVEQMALGLAAGLLIAFILQAAGQFLRTYYLHKGAWSFIADIRTIMFEKLENLSMRFYGKRQTGELISRVISDTSALETLIAHAAPDMIVNIFMFAGVLIILFTVNIKMTAISMSVMPFIGVAVWVFAVKVRPMFKQSHQKNSELSAVLQDNFSGMKEIQVFNKQDSEKKRVRKYADAHCSAIMAALTRSAVYHPLIEFCNNLGLVCIIAAGGYMVSSGEADASDIVAFILYINMLYRPVNTLGRLNEDLQNSLAASERIFEILDTESEVKDAPDAYDMPEAEGEIRFEDVTFRYETGDVLKNANITVNPGETLALVGPTGAGKTTFISLVSRFYDPSEGRILIDGNDIKKVTQKSLRDNISVVLQDVFLFNGTIYENIAYGCENATYEQVISAAKVANAHEFITATENGYDTVIGERGVRLSGGQKQRLAIARAVLRNTPILILDEATASVDTVTEQLIQNAINKVSANRTTIIIAHRLSTVRNADKIAVIENGRIVEFGTHDELSGKNGLYASLCRIQLTNQNIIC